MAADTTKDAIILSRTIFLPFARGLFSFSPSVSANTFDLLIQTSPERNIPQKNGVHSYGNQ